MDEDYEERAAIMQYDGGLSREEAERKAYQITSSGKSPEGVTDERKRNDNETNCKKG